MTRIPVHLTFSAVILILTACSGMKRMASGADNELVVVSSPSDRPAISAILRMIFNDTLFTPAPEPCYQFIFVEPDDFGDLKNRVNLVIGSLGSDLTNPATRLVRSLLTSEQFEATISGNNQIIVTRDLFARDQLVMIISTPEQELARKLARVQRDWIRGQYTDLLEKRQRKYILSQVRQEKLERTLLEKYRWSIHVPWGYTVIRDSSEQGFFWMGRDIPYRWIAVHWEAGLVVQDSLAAVDYTHRFPETYFGNIRYSDYRFRLKAVTFKHWSGWRGTGVWEHTQEAQGGPFISYVFYDGVTDRTYFIHLVIFYPGQDKYLLLRQLDLVVHSFYVVEGDS